MSTEKEGQAMHGGLEVGDPASGMQVYVGLDLDKNCAFFSVCDEDVPVKVPNLRLINGLAPTFTVSPKSELELNTSPEGVLPRGFEGYQPLAMGVAQLFRGKETGKADPSAKRKVDATGRTLVLDG